MSRTDFLELIQRDLDGDLTPVEKELLNRQLQSDPELQLMHARLLHVSESLEQLPPVTPPFSLVDAILPQLDSSSPDPVQTEAQPRMMELPRLEKKSEISSAEPKRRAIPAWLLKASSGVVAASLLFGIYAMAHKANQTQVQDDTNGSPSVQSTTVQPTPAAEPSKEQTPAPGAAQTGTPAKTDPAQGKQTKPKTHVNPPSVAATQETKPGGKEDPSKPKANPSPYKPPANKATASEKDEKKDKSKSTRNPKAVQPSHDRPGQSEQPADPAKKKETDKNNGNRNGNSNREQQAKNKEPNSKEKGANKDQETDKEKGTNKERNNGNAGNADENRSSKGNEKKSSLEVSLSVISMIFRR